MWILHRNKLYNLANADMVVLGQGVFQTELYILYRGNWEKLVFPNQEARDAFWNELCDELVNDEVTLEE